MLINTTLVLRKVYHN